MQSDARTRLILRTLIVGSVVIIAGVIALTISTLTKPDSNNPTGINDSQQEQVSGFAAIQISRKGFIPATIKVKSGTEVTWTNNDSKPHRVASNPHPDHTDLEGLDSQQNIPPKGTYTYLFDKPGTYSYHDHLNPTRNGTVVVE